MSLSREEKLSVFKKIHPDLLNIMLGALIEFSEKFKDRDLPSLFTLVQFNEDLAQAWGYYTGFYINDESMSKEKVSEIIDTIQRYMAKVIMSVELSNLNMLQNEIAKNIKKLNSKEFHNSLQSITESKTFPTENIYERLDENNFCSLLLFALDIFRNIDQEKVSKFNVCKNLINFTPQMIKNEIEKSVQSKKISTQNRFKFNTESTEKITPDPEQNKNSSPKSYSF